MKVLIIGAGPAGLAFAALMAEGEPEHKITLLERNVAHVRPGFGIALRNDAISFLGLDKTLPYQRLEGRSFRRRGEVIIDLPNPPDAHPVTLPRAALITALADRCSRSGVQLRCEIDAARLRASDLEDFDLVVGADGAHSAVRRMFEHAFAPVVECARNRYAWFGADKPLSKLTIMLNDEQHALLAWGYKYTESLSTFIVECSEAAFVSYGFERLSLSDAAAEIAKIFAADLKRGAVICGDATQWSRFLKISCARLYYRNVVLLGDAAHTTHFSQGFGTMFAFDDALALYSALSSTKRVSSALDLYEQAQRPKIAEFQEASFASMRWSEMLMEAAETDDEARLNQLVGARWPQNEVIPGPLHSPQFDTAVSIATAMP